MEFPKEVGSIENKFDISKLIKQYELPLTCLALIHLRGSEKYPIYGWINDPENTNSSIKDNVNAMWRHFISHTMGKCIDPEGLPHLFHLICRAGMLVTTYYRQQNKLLPRYDKIHKSIPYSVIGKFITVEELYSLYQVDNIDLSDNTIDALIPAITDNLFVLSSINNKEMISEFSMNLLFKIINQFVILNFDQYPELYHILNRSFSGMCVRLFSPTSKDDS